MAIDINLRNPSRPDASTNTSLNRRRNIRFGISRADWNALSGNAILSRLRNVGRGIGSQAFFRIRREVLRSFDDLDALNLSPDQNLIPVKSLREGVGLRLSKNLRFKVRIRGTNIDTGDRETIFAHVIFDNLPTKGQLFDLVRERLDHRFVDKTPRLEDLELTIDSALIREGVSPDTFLG